MSFQVNHGAGTGVRLADNTPFALDKRNPIYANEYVPWLHAGGTPEVIISPSVPESAERGRFMEALEIAGLYDEVQAWITTAPRRVRIALRETTVFYRASGRLQQMYAALPSNLGKTAQQLSDGLDALFLAAAAATINGGS